jgi:hypothetical protein
VPSSSLCADAAACDEATTSSNALQSRAAAMPCFDFARLKIFNVKYQAAVAQSSMDILFIQNHI